MLAPGHAPAAGAHAGVHAFDPCSVVDALAAAAVRRAWVRLVLSARQCRYAVLPWLTSDASGHAIERRVHASLRERYDVDASTHHVTIDWPRFGQPIVAAAYPLAPVIAIREALGAAGHVLIEVEGSVDRVLRAHGRALGLEPGLLAYAEDDGITALTVEQGTLVQVETLSGSAGGLEDLAHWWARKQVAFDTSERMYWLDAMPVPDGMQARMLPVHGADRTAAGRALAEMGL